MTDPLIQVGGSSAASSAEMSQAMQRIISAEAALTGMANAPYMRGTRGKVTVSAAIASLAAVDFPVTFDVPLPVTTYNAVIGFEGADTGILGSLTAMVKAGSKTATGCTVTVKNSALLSLGLNVVVTVVALY